MSQNDDRIHKPSARQLRKAAEGGLHPRSADLGVALALTSGCLLVAWYASDLSGRWIEMYEGFYTDSFHELSAIEEVVKSLPLLILNFAAPVALGVWFVSLLVAWIQSPKVIRKDSFLGSSSEWNPAARWESLFSWKSPGRLLFQAVRIVAVASVAWLGIEKLGTLAIQSEAGSVISAVKQSASVITATLLQVCMILITFAVFDRIWRQKQWWNSVCMTREEVQKEQRELYGDPALRKKRKKLHRSAVASMSAKTAAMSDTQEESSL